jgi:hypothetical protein
VHLAPREDHGDPIGAPGPHDLVEPGQLLPEHVPVEEEQCAQRLVLGGRGHVVLHGQRTQKLRDLGPAHLRRMALAVEEDEAADPGDIGLLGAAAAVARPEGGADLVEQPRRAGP